MDKSSYPTQKFAADGQMILQVEHNDYELDVVVSVNVVVAAVVAAVTVVGMGCRPRPSVSLSPAVCSTGAVYFCVLGPGLLVRPALGLCPL